MEYPNQIIEEPNQIDLLVDSFEQVLASPDDGLLDVPNGVPLKRLGVPAASIRQVVRAGVLAHEGRDAWDRVKKGFKAGHEPIRQPLFPTLPETADIHQRSMGDCWFLAALAAIVGMGSGWAIKLMMRSVAAERHFFSGSTVRLQGGRREYKHAIVRLFDQGGNPQYLVVEKSLVETNIPGQTYYATGAPWAAVLEKAMTAIDTSGADHPSAGGTYDPRGANYLRLKSGRSHVAFKALLGVNVLYEQLTPAVYHGGDVVEANQIHVQRILSGAAGDRPPAAVMRELFQRYVPHYRAELFYCLAWEAWVGRVLGAGTSLRSDYRLRAAMQGPQTGTFRQEDFERLMTDAAATPQHQALWNQCVTEYVNDEVALLQPHNRQGADGPVGQRPAPWQHVPVPQPLPPPLPLGPPPPLPAQLPRPRPFGGAFLGPAPTLQQAVQCVCDWVRGQRFFAGKRGSGRYTLAQDGLYREILEHLRHHRPVCLGTHEYPATPPPGGVQAPGRHGASGEHLSKGLAGPHAYAVLGCKQVGEVKYVRVHNPWGHTGRGYTFAQDYFPTERSQDSHERLQKRYDDPNIPDQRKIEQAFETAAGTFWLELSDLTKRCQALYSCRETPAVILQGRERAGWPIV